MCWSTSVPDCMLVDKCAQYPLRDRLMPGLILFYYKSWAEFYLSTNPIKLDVIPLRTFLQRC